MTDPDFVELVLARHDERNCVLDKPIAFLHDAGTRHTSGILPAGVGGLGIASHHIGPRVSARGPIRR